MPHADNLSRALLALILLCLVVGILRGDGGSSPAATGNAPEVAARSSGGERYILRVIGLQRKPPLMLRTDTATGEAWMMGVQGPGVWKALREGPDGVPAAGAVAAGRFEIYAVKLRRGAPNLVRVDHLTGRIWRTGSTSGGAWVAVPNPGEPSPAAAGSSRPPPAAADDDIDSAAPEGGDAVEAADDDLADDTE